MGKNNCKHTWETEIGIIRSEQKIIIDRVKGIRKCIECGYIPPTKRAPLPPDMERMKMEKKMKRR